MTPAFVISFLAKGLFSKSGRRLLTTTAAPAKAQEELLLEIVKRNVATVFGREHGFDQVRTIADFKSKVPIRTFDELEPYFRRMADGEWRILTMEAPTFFGQTSGTTGPVKLIPVTASYREEVWRSRLIWYRQVALAFPKLLRGQVLMVRSPKIEGKTAGGIPFGSVTVGLQRGIAGVDKVAPEHEVFPQGLFLIERFEARYYTLLRHALSVPLSIFAAINPSTIVLLARKLDEHAERLAEDVERGTLSEPFGPGLVPEALKKELLARYRPDPRTAARIRRSREKHGFVRPIDVWPRLTGILCWKAGPASFYLDQLPRFFGDLPSMCWGFCATEGNFSIPLDHTSNDGVLAVMSHFMEFVEEADWDRGVRETKLVHELEVGKRYRVIVTGSHGLYRYDLNDVVEVTGMFQATPKVRFSHKSGTIVSITGEKLTELQVTAALGRASAEVGVELVGFTLGLRLADPPRYVAAIEPKAPLDPATRERLRSASDEALSRANIEYASKRGSERLGPLELTVVPAGAFDEERARRVAAGSPDAHVKIPYLQGDQRLIERLSSGAPPATRPAGLAAGAGAATVAGGS